MGHVKVILPKNVFIENEFTTLNMIIPILNQFYVFICYKKSYVFIFIEDINYNINDENSFNEIIYQSSKVHKNSFVLNSNNQQQMKFTSYKIWITMGLTAKFFTVHNTV